MPSRYARAMRAILPYDSRPEAEQPKLGEVPSPVVGAGEVLVRVRATALNRADLLQMRGWYPPPPGESEIPGLECAGDVVEIGDGVKSWAAGDRVMALLAGGGHAERVVVPAGQLMPIPDRLSYTEAAALPEVAITAWTNLVAEGLLTAGERVLVTAAASGVGTFAVQLAKALGADVLVAGRDRGRLERLRPLGADHVLLLGESLPAAVRDATGGHGVDLAIDLVGGTQFPRVLGALRARGRVVLVGVLAGSETTVDLADVLRRRLRIVGSVLRARSRAEKAALVAAFHDFAQTRLDEGRLRPIVDRVFPFEGAVDAYRQLAAGGVWGKIVLELSP